MSEEEKRSEELEDGEEMVEVVELESDDGELEEFVIIDRIEADGRQYAMMALLEDVENMESMSEEEFQEFYGEDPVFIIMRQEDETFLELTDEEFDKIQGSLEKKISQGSE